MDEFGGLDASWLAIIRSWASGLAIVERVYLYGSRARGDYRADSDIDLGIILVEKRTAMDEEPWIEWVAMAREWRDELASRLPVQPHVQAAFADDKVVLPSIMREGVLLFEREAKQCSYPPP